MAETGIGGFFVKLGLKTDEASLDKGKQSLAGVGKEAKALTTALGLTGTAMLALAKSAGNMATAELKAAKAIGVGTQSLAQWRTAAAAAGTSGAGLVSSMQQIEDKMQKMKLGQVDTGLAKNLAFMGLGLNDFSKMDANQRMAAVFSKADSMQDQRKAAVLVGEVLGSAGRDYYDYLKLSGKTLEQQLAEAKKLTYVNETAQKGAMAFRAEFDQVKTAAKNITQYFGTALADRLAPIVKRIKEIIAANKELIQAGIDNFVSGIARGVQGLLDYGAKLAPVIHNFIDNFGKLNPVVHKLGIGIGALGLTGMAGSLTKILGSVGLLKGSLGGLMGMFTGGLKKAGLFLLIEDLLTYLEDPNPDLSMFGTIMAEIDKLKKKFDIKLDLNDFKELGEVFGDLIKSIGKGETVSEALRNIAGALGQYAVSNIKAAMDVLKDLVKLLQALWEGDWGAVRENLVKFFDDLGVSIAASLGLKKIDSIDVNGSKSPIALAGDSGVLDQINYAANARKYEGNDKKLKQIETQRAMGTQTRVEFNRLTAEEQNELAKYLKKYPHLGQAIKNYFIFGKGEFESLKTASEKIQDGIVRPNGGVVQVAPDDWVFAVRNIGDLAAGFAGGIRGGNTMNAPASYTITQNITVNGGNNTAAAVRQQAYAGASAALLQARNNAQRISQMMPGNV